jgi:uncharacterized protein YbjT (DUF2867 family)
VFSLSPIWLLPQALPALKARGMTRLVAFSSTSRFTKQDSAEPSERAVAQALAESEAKVEAFCAVHGVAWTILRPTLIYLEGRDGNVSRLAGLIRRFKVLPLSGKGDGLRQPVHADDLAAGAIAAAQAPTARDEAYDLVGGETLTYRVMAERIYEGLGRRPLILPLPAWLFRLLLTLAKPFYPGATATMGDRMAQDLTFDDDPGAAGLRMGAEGLPPSVLTVWPRDGARRVQNTRTPLTTARSPSAVRWSGPVERRTRRPAPPAGPSLARRPRNSPGPGPSGPV